MRLFELKFEIKSDEKEKIIRAVGLVYSRQYRDTDYFLESKGQSKKKYKEVEGRTILYDLNYNHETGFFEIDDEEVTENFNKIDQIKKLKVLKEIHRTKDIYIWPGKPVRVSFDVIDNINNRLFCEIYDKDEASVFEAKRIMVELGFTKFINKTYDELIDKNFSIINIIIISIIIIITVIIIFLLFK